MGTRLTPDLLTESEATLRLVGALIEELGVQEDAIDGGADAGVGRVLELIAREVSGSMDYARTFLRIYLVVVSALHLVRRARMDFGAGGLAGRESGSVFVGGSPAESVPSAPGPDPPAQVLLEVEHRLEEAVRLFEAAGVLEAGDSSI